MRLTNQLGVNPSRTRNFLIFIISTSIKHTQNPFFSFVTMSTLSPTTTPVSDDQFGFDRPEMYSASLGNTVDYYQRHVFLCYKNAQDWPPKLESSTDDPLPQLFSAALKARKDDLPLKTRLTICGEGNETESNGDVLIFPEMIKYRGLKESDVDAFIDDVLVNGKPWASGVPESLVGAYVFVCAHASRDKRCGVCGPILTEKFKEEIALRSLNDQVIVNTCSHIGGHKYAGNVIIFGTSAEGKVIGDWYGYVTPADVPDLLDVHVGNGEIIEKLWRGQMGLKVETTAKLENNKPAKEDVQEKTKETSQGNGEKAKENISSCCQGSTGVSCCRDGSQIDGKNGEVDQKITTEELSKKSSVSMAGWIGKWEQGDVFVAAGVIGAVATVAVAYSIFRRLS